MSQFGITSMYLDMKSFKIPSNLEFCMLLEFSQRLSLSSLTNSFHVVATAGKERDSMFNSILTFLTLSEKVAPMKSTCMIQSEQTGE